MHKHSMCARPPRTSTTAVHSSHTYCMQFDSVTPGTVAPTSLTSTCATERLRIEQ